MLDARMCALDILHKTIKEGAYPNLIFKKVTNDLDISDKKFVTLLVNDTLQNLIHIDYIISFYTKDKKIKPIIKDILRLGVDQIKFLNISSHAAINESVELVRKIGKPMLCGFVNGVLRNVAKNESIIYPKENTLEYYSVIHSKPLWILELWDKEYGFDNAIKYSKPRISPTVIRANENIDLFLQKQNIKYKPIDFLSNCYELETSFDLHNTTEFKSGQISIQGVGSICVCKTLDPKENENILDACSAPGGKTVCIGQLMHKGSITACDLYDGRLELVKSNAKRVGIDFIKTQKCDMTVFNKEFENKFDKVLVDAPCSGLGVINSKPDIILNKSLEHVYDLSKIQYKILTNCSKYVKSGGTLVYSTCSITKIENDNVIAKFLNKNSDFELVPIVIGDKKIESGMMQLTPDEYEGFFVAKMIKK